MIVFQMIYPHGMWHWQTLLKEQSEKVLVDEVPPVSYIPAVENQIKLANEQQVNEEQDYLRKKDIKFPKTLFNFNPLMVDLHQKTFIDP